jgi:membrane associated rhomboid family serine protease
MGLYDRDYMREEESGYRPRPPGAPWSPTIALLFVLGAVYLVQIVVGLGADRWIENQFGLSLAGIRSGCIWQFVTFQFLHGSIPHLLLNGITLYSFGRFMEQQLGRGRFLLLYFISGTAGGLLQILATWLLRQDPVVPAVGASAGIAGLLGAFMLAYPNLQLILFPLPFKIRAWTLLWIVLPISIIGTAFPNLPVLGGIAHAAHLGGLLAGGAFIRFRLKTKSQAPPPFLSKTPPPEEIAQDDFIRDKVDPILEKIAAHGIHSLSERERKVLEEARKRMGKS